MKNKLLLAIMVIVLTSCGKKTMTLKVDCSVYESTNAAIMVKSSEGYDTLARYDDFVGYFEYSTEVKSPRYVYVAVENVRYPLGLVTEPGEYELKFSQGGAFEYEGGPLYQSFRRLYKHPTYAKLYKAYLSEAENVDWKNADSREKERVYSISDKAEEVLRGLYDSIRSIDPVQALLAAEFSRELGSNPKQAIKMINQLDRTIYDTEVKRWNKEYNEKESLKAIQNKLSVGKTFYDFRIKDKDGNEVTLKDVLRGNKLIMVEFWASWCHPCRAEIPYLKKDYKAFHDQGFEIISISVDRKKEQWLKALNEENLPWYNVRDGIKLSDKCGIKGIPANWLLDENGVIVAKDLRGHHVEEYLKEHL